MSGADIPTSPSSMASAEDKLQVMREFLNKRLSILDDNKERLASKTVSHWHSKFMDILVVIEGASGRSAEDLDSYIESVQEQLARFDAFIDLLSREQKPAETSATVFDPLRKRFRESFDGKVPSLDGIGW